MGEMRILMCKSGTDSYAEAADAVDCVLSHTPVMRTDCSVPSLSFDSGVMGDYEATQGSACAGTASEAAPGYITLKTLTWSF